MSIKNYGDYAIQQIKMLNRDEDNILEGMNELLSSQNEREKRIKKLCVESFTNLIQIMK